MNLPPTASRKFQVSTAILHGKKPCMVKESYISVSVYNIQVAEPQPPDPALSLQSFVLTAETALTPGGFYLL